MRSKPFSAPGLLTNLVEDQEEPVLRATLISKFPMKFLNDSIVPKLEARGVQVDRIMHPKGAALMESVNGDTVLFMHEISSHGELKNAKDLADRSGVPLICLSRKASLWDKLLPDRLAKLEFEPENLNETLETNAGEDHMPDPITRAVPNDQIEAMLRHMMYLHGQGFGYSEMVPELRQYWVHGELTGGNQLRSYLGNILSRADCPDFYKKWAKEGRPAVSKKRETIHGMRHMTDEELVKILKFVMDSRNKNVLYKDIVEPVKKIWPGGEGPDSVDQLIKFASSASKSPRCPAWFKTWYDSARTRPGKTAFSHAEKPASPASEVAEKEALPEPPPTKASDDAELAKMYAAENETLKLALRKWQQRVSELEQALNNSGTGKMKEDLEEIFASCEKLMAIGAINFQETVRIAVAYLRRT